MTEKGVTKPEKMSPTDKVANYHGLRAHLQIVTWKLLDSKEIQLDPREQGWQWKNGQNLRLINTDREIAADSIFESYKM